MIEFRYPYDLNTDLAHVQIELADQVIKEDVAGNLDNVVGVDVSFSMDNRAVAAAVLVDLKSLEIVEKVNQEVVLSFPYVPGFLGFREADAMVSILRELENSFDVIMVNGHGILHPRGFGLASQVGLLMDAPTVGLAKRLIAGNYIKRDVSSFNKDKFPVQPVVLEKEMAGVYMNGYYVSIGHKIAIQTAIELVKETSIYKTPEPIRQAHILATQIFKDILKVKSV